MQLTLAENIRKFRKERKMTQEQLARTLFPLGSLSKEKVRRVAEEHGFLCVRDFAEAEDGTVYVASTTGVAGIFMKSCAS